MRDAIDQIGFVRSGIPNEFHPDGLIRFTVEFIEIAIAEHLVGIAVLHEAREQLPNAADHDVVRPRASADDLPGIVPFEIAVVVGSAEAHQLDELAAVVQPIGDLGRAVPLQVHSLIEGLGLVVGYLPNLALAGTPSAILSSCSILPRIEFHSYS